MPQSDLKIFDNMAALADGVRCRLLLLLELEELTVSDLCTVLQLPQSTVSRHLKLLLDKGWVMSRPEGTRRLYRSTVDRLDGGARQLWALTRTEVADMSAAKVDGHRLKSVLAQTRSRSQAFFDSSGERWDSLRDELFGSNFYLCALMGLLPNEWIVSDLGCGTGTVAAALAPFVKKVIGVDASSSMLAQAEHRLAPFDNVELQQGELEALPLPASQIDVATMILVLHHLEHPLDAVREAARCLRPGGSILIVDMLPHDRESYQIEMGHMWLGFSEDNIRELLDEAGFGATRFQVLPPAPEAKGPNLFAVSASKRSE